MRNIDRIRELIADTAAEMRLIIKEEGPRKLKIDIERMVKYAEQPDKTSLCKMTNYEIFIIFLILTNDDRYTYEEIKEYCEHAKKAINNWTLAKDGEALIEMQNQTNQDGSLKDYSCLSTFTALGLTPIFSDFKMRLIYTCMYEFLRLKQEILSPNEITKKLPYKNRILIMQNNYRSNRLSNFIEVAKNYIDKQMDKHTIRIELAKTRLKYTKEFERALEQGEVDNLTEVPAKWHQYLDPRILEELYDHVEENLLAEYSKLEKQEADLTSQLNGSEIVKYLFARNLNPYSLPGDVLSYLEQTPDILSHINFFTSLNIPLQDVLTKYYNHLVTLTKDKIEFINTLITQGVLTKETIKSNLSLLNENYQRLLTNYELLKDLIDTNNIFYSDLILLAEPKTIRNILSVLKEYNLTRNNYIFLLCNFDYIGIYDLLLEHDIPVSLFISICKTTNPLNTVKRILIYKSIDEPYTNSNNLLRKDITVDSKFICDDSQLDEYLPNHVNDVIFNEITGTCINGIGTNQLAKHLDSEYRVEDIYVIGDVNISRAKFLRNFESVNGNPNLFIASLVSGSIIDERDYHKLISELKQHTLKK